MDSDLRYTAKPYYPPGFSPKPNIPSNAQIHQNDNGVLINGVIMNTITNPFDMPCILNYTIIRGKLGIRNNKNFSYFS